jgi:hypothetical protein
LVTNLEPAQLNPRQWLDCNRLAWGIENGLHQRLDISLRDDDCRVRIPRSMHILGMFRRLSTSLFMHWRSLQLRPARERRSVHLRQVHPQLTFPRVLRAFLAPSAAARQRAFYFLLIYCKKLVNRSDRRFRFPV